MMIKNGASKTMKLLPEYFQPSVNDVVIGRGRKIFVHNRAFRLLVASRLPEYSLSNNKVAKSYIIRHIVAQVRFNSPNGGFVKKDPKTGRWYEIGNFLARERTSQAFRDILFEQYKSSNTSKKLRRIYDQSIQLPPSSFSTVSAGECRDQEQLTSAHVLPFHSYEIDQNIINSDEPIGSIRNFEWDNSMNRSRNKADDGIAVASLPEKTRPPSARSVLDFALQEQVANDGAIGCPPNNSSAKKVFKMDTRAPPSLCLKQPSLSSITKACHSAVHGNMSLRSEPAFTPIPQQCLPQSSRDDELFERLVALAGHFSFKGDPFDPVPIMT
jgi:hypothetical protein